MNFWTIYFVMQADTICAALWIIFGLSTLIAGAWSGVTLDQWSEREKKEGAKSVKRVWKKLRWILPPILLLALIMPNTKTLATAIVLPAVANNETIQEEAGDLYNIAKSALKGALVDEKESVEAK